MKIRRIFCNFTSKAQDFYHYEFEGHVCNVFLCLCYPLSYMLGQLLYYSSWYPSTAAVL